MIIVLREGEVAERGSHEELLALPDGLYASMWREQSTSYANADKPTTMDNEAPSPKDDSATSTHHHHHH